MERTGRSSRRRWRTRCPWRYTAACLVKVTVRARARARVGARVRGRVRVRVRVSSLPQKAELTDISPISPLGRGVK